MKKLLVLAIAAGLSATAAADATLYGQLHGSIDAVDGAIESTSVSSNSSRIGIKGSADLAGGMKGIYKAEFGTDTGGNGANLSNRNQVVGLAGGFGAVLVGRHDTPYKTVGRKLDLGWSTQIGSNYNMVARGKGANWDIRPNNVVAYQTPKMGGFQGMLAYVTENGGDDRGALSLSGIYASGPLSLLAAFESHNKEWYDTDANGAPIATAVEDESSYRLGATYKMGNTKVVGMYQAIADEAGVSGSDRDIVGLGAASKVSSAGTIKGQYYVADGDVQSDEATMLSIGYDHAFSKSTTVYAQYSTIDGEAGNTLYQMGTYGRSDGTAADAGGDADGFSIGIRQTF